MGEQRKPEWWRWLFFIAICAVISGTIKLLREVGLRGVISELFRKWDPVRDSQALSAWYGLFFTASVLIAVVFLVRKLFEP